MDGSGDIRPCSEVENALSVSSAMCHQIYSLGDVFWMLDNPLFCQARLAQSVEHETLNLRVVGSCPTLGDDILMSGGGMC